MKKLDLRDPATVSRDPIAEALERTQDLFPEAWTEGKINFNVLKQLLGGAIDEREEKYGLSWHGKRQARQLALTPSTGTLRPRLDESVNWGTTGNLIIEGDNLEVLKLLQKSYAGKVKLIYIDPPYNTGNDFVYSDDYANNIKAYLELTNQLEGGNKVRSNTEAGGRFHTAWLNMIYPRLKLARSLMRPDGLICLSIDDNERDNLKSVCDEIFGEENFVESIIWKKRYGGGPKEKHLVSVHEYVLVYARDASELGELYVPQSPEAIQRYYTKRDDNFETRGPYRTHPLEATKSMGDRHKLVFPIRGPGGIEITPRRQWLWSRERVASALANNEIEFIKDREGAWTAHSKQYLREPDGEVRSAKAFSIIDDVYSQHGTNELLDLFGDAHIFPFPKPTGLIRPLLEFGAPDRDSIVLDFFAGSGTTAEALMAWNATDSGNRRFILVQIPEPIDPEKNKSAALLCDELHRPRNIAELTKERVRRSSQRIKDAYPLFSGDFGFRCFGLDTSNFQPWQPEGRPVPQLLMEAVDHLLPNRSQQDILYELVLKLGLDLSARIESWKLNEAEISAVQPGALIACLTDSIRQDDVEMLAHAILELHATLAQKDDVVCVFRDSAFENDVAKTNMDAILGQQGLLAVRSI
jgi:adenine-specific DNA-methyltransferase